MLKDEATKNKENHVKLFQKERPEYNKDTFRGLKAVVLKEEDELVPVCLKNSEEYFEGLYFLVKKNSQTI